jgi:hypothetical protein
MLPFSILCCCLLLAPLSFSQSFAENFSVPSLKVRPNSERFFPTKGDNILLRVSGRIPLGSDHIFLSSDHTRSASIMASAETPQFGTITVFEHHGHRYIVNGRGEPIERLPSHITFRVTASALLNLAEKPFRIDSKTPMQDFLKGLTFVARVFHPGELKAQTVRPTSVRTVGVPLNIGANERVFRASFDVGPLSVRDHVVLDVNTADGTPVSKFFLQLNNK